MVGIKHVHLEIELGIRTCFRGHIVKYFGQARIFVTFIPIFHGNDQGGHACLPTNAYSECVDAGLSAAVPFYIIATNDMNDFSSLCLRRIDY